MSKFELKTLSPVIGECNVFQDLYDGDYLRGFALALQQDPTDLESDCYLNTEKTAQTIQGFIKAVWDSYIYTFANNPENLPHELQDENLGLIPWFRPLMWMSTLSVVLSDTMVACNFKSAMKQVGFRFATQSGAQDFLYLVVSSFLGFLGRYEYFFKNPLYDVIEPMFTVTPSGHKVTCL